MSSEIVSRPDAYLLEAANKLTKLVGKRLTGVIQFSRYEAAATKRFLVLDFEDGSEVEVQVENPNA